MTADAPAPSALERLRDVLEHPSTRMALSALILASLLPGSVIEGLRLGFFAVFSLELVTRTVVLVASRRAGERTRRQVLREVPFLLLDFAATLSFLDWGLSEGRFLRLFRLTRLILLLGYWRGFLADLWRITWRRERRYQFAFVGTAVLIATLAGAATLGVVVTEPHDYDGNGSIGAEDESFSSRVWWAFRQVQDPGNLVADPRNRPLLVISAVLTVGGLLVFSFLVGVGTTVVEELVVSSRQQRIGLRGHAVVIGGGAHRRFLLEELQGFRAKRVLERPIVLFGTEPERPSALRSGRLRAIHYRHGDPSDPEDLARVDVARAALVMLLADEKGGDASLVSRLLAVRQINPDCRIVADVLRARNVRSVLEAGGQGTEVVRTRHFVGLALAAELVSPGLEGVLRELLTSRGQEIYLASWPEESDPPAFAEAVRLARTQGVLPIGFRTGSGPEQAFRLNPAPGERLEGVSGVLCVAASSSRAAAGAREIARGGDRARGPASGDGAAEPSWTLSPSRELARVRRVLVCGYREEIVGLLEELAGFLDGLEVRLMVAEGRADATIRELVGDDSEADPDCGFRRTGPRELVLSGRRAVRLVVFEGDPSRDESLLACREADHRLEDTDAVLFVADPGWGQEPDAKPALGLLKLSRLAGEAGHRFRPGFRVVAEVQQAGKADLLENRLLELRASHARGGPGATFAVLSTEKLRHYLLGQAVLVPGIAEVHGELLGAAGQDLVKLVPEPGAPTGRRWSFDRLIQELHPAGLLPLAVELEEDGHARVVVNPPPGSADALVHLAEVTGLFCVADAGRLPARIPLPAARVPGGARKS